MLPAESHESGALPSFPPSSYRLTIDATSGDAKATYERSKVLVTFSDAD